MKAKFLLGLGSIILLASSLAAGEIRFERGHYTDHKHKKSHNVKPQKHNKKSYVKRAHHKDSYYLTRAEKRYLEHKRMKAQERQREMRHRYYERDRAATIINLATLPLIIHDAHVRRVAFSGYGY